MTRASRGSRHKQPDPAPVISESRRRFVALWSRAWGLIGAVIVVFVAYRLPETLRSGDSMQLLRDVGMLLLCFNLIMQATRPHWPMTYSVPLTIVGIAMWLFGWLA